MTRSSYSLVALQIILFDQSHTSLLQAGVMTMKDLCNEMKDEVESFSHDMDSQTSSVNSQTYHVCH